MRMHTRICDRFGIDVPIVQTGMGWVAGPRLVSATAAHGSEFNKPFCVEVAPNPFTTVGNQATTAAASQVALSGHHTQEKTICSPGSAWTALFMSVRLPSGT